MGLVGRLNQHFNPWNITVQLKEDSGARDCMGLAGSALMATAAIGYLFFGASIQTCGCLGVTGACFFASYWTGKDGYAWLVGVAAGSGLVAATVDAIRSGRFFVHLDINVAKIIEQVRKPYPPSH